MSLYTEWLEICKTYEFPHSHFYSSDLKEVLQMFAFLKEQYGKLLKVVDDINVKMDTLDVKIAEDISKALIPYTEKINNVIIETDRKIEELENFVLNQNSKTLSEVNLLITTEKIERNNADLELLDLIQKNTELLEVSIKELENKIIESGMAVINPRRSKLQTVQETVNDLYLAILQSGSYTSTELSVYPTCDDIKTEQMSFDEFAVSSRKLDRKLINNVVTGKKGTIEYALSSLKGFNQPLGLTNEEMSEYNITAEDISNALLNYTLFLCRSGIVLHSEKINLGIWKDGKDLYLSSVSKSSDTEQDTVIELEEIDRIVDIIILKTNNDGIVIDVTNSISIDLLNNRIVIPQSVESNVYDIKILWT